MGHYTGCNTAASLNLHPVAFNVLGAGATLCYMERKRQNYIKEWRKKAGLTQKELVDRLVILAGDHQPDDPTLRIPTTEASLSRIENGKQNFSIGTLEAIATALDVEEAGWLLDRNPSKAGELVNFWDHKLNAEQQVQALAVLEAMFGKAQ
jgi:transcriptional regulator with XRE-family HTH domain